MRAAYFTRVLLLLTAVAGINACDESSGGGSSTGTGGSTARMTIVGDYLYAIANADVQLFDISTPSTPNPWARVNVDWNIETLFPHQNYLLVGAADGLHILDNSDPANPEYVGDFRHATARDPVVASENYAYVTLSSEFAGPNELNIIDIVDVRAPRLVKTLAMQQPTGLAVTQQRLYVCDGAAGLKIFDRTDPVELLLTATVSDINCNDVIAAPADDSGENSLLTILPEPDSDLPDSPAEPERLLAITATSLVQFDVSELPPVELSILAIK